MDNKNEKFNSNDKIVKKLLIIFKQIAQKTTFQEGIISLQNLIRENIDNEKNMNYIIQQIYNHLLNLQNENKKIVITIIPFIINIAEIKIYPYIEKILNIYQKSICEESSKIFNLISKSFGDSTKILFYSKGKILNNSNTKNNILEEKELNLYNKLLKFCFSNIENPNEINQLCGILCLNSFIENCSFNYSNEENLKKILETLLNLLEKKNFIGQLELLNCLITLIFLSESNFSKYASVTLYKIIDLITDKEWKKRKLALNIVYTLIYYCGNEILSLKDFLLEFLLTIKNDSNKEVKEVCLQIIKMLNNDNSFNGSFLSEYNCFFGKENSPILKNNKIKNSISHKKLNNDINDSNHFKQNTKNSIKSKSVILNNNENSILDFGNNQMNNISSISNNTEGEIKNKFFKKKNKQLSSDLIFKTRNLDLNPNKKYNNKSHNLIKTYNTKKYNKQFLINNNNNNNNKIKNKFLNVNLSNNSTPRKNLSKSKTKSVNYASPNLFEKKILKNEKKNEIEFDISKIREYRENIEIMNLKEEIEFLKKEITQMKKNKKIKKDLKNYINQNKYIEAFRNAISLEKISNIYYIIKHYQMNSIKINIPEDILSEISRILSSDILECENLRLVSVFLIQNICEKKKTINKLIGRNLGNVYKELLSKSKELCFCKLDIDYFSIIVEYFSKY